MFGPCPKTIFLFGDSLTQQGYDQEHGFGWVAALSNAYIRLMNVVNSGLSGYNTDMALTVLPRVIPPPEWSKIDLIFIFFGANDAVLEQYQQHVPLQRYKDNLKKTVRHKSIQAHKPQIILVTPPPIDEQLLEQDRLARGLDKVERKVDVTLQYAEVVKQVAAEEKISVLDLWTIFSHAAGWTAGQALLGRGQETSGERELARYLRDGLHLTAEGQKIVFESVMQAIQSSCSHLAPDRLTSELPYWADFYSAT